jgi:cytochrome c oxidase subunit II
MTVQGINMTGSMLASGLQDWFIRLNFREPGASTVAADSDSLYWLIFLQSLFFFVLLMVLMVYFALKYRKRPGVAPQRSAAHNTFLELSWSVIPTILLVWLFFRGFWGFADHLVAPANAPELILQAQKWAWTVTYPNGGASPETTRSRQIDPSAQVTAVKYEGAVDTPIFVVPEKLPVKFRMYSIDVIHSFWIPDFRVKFDVFPNRYTSVWFEPTGITGTAKLPNEGGWKKWAGTPYQDHWVFCAEYCGSNHSEMAAIVRVVPKAIYDDILKAWAEPKGPLWERGRAFYKIKGCVSCHSVDGSKNVGPSWKDLYLSQQPITGGAPVLADADYIRSSVYEPARQIVAGYPNQMQTYQGKVNEPEFEALLAYMKYLSTHTPAADLEAIKGDPDAGKEAPKQ